MAEAAIRGINEKMATVRIVVVQPTFIQNKAGNHDARRVGGMEARVADRSDDLPLGERKEAILVVEDEAVVRQFAIGDLTEPSAAADGAKPALQLLYAYSRGFG